MAKKRVVGDRELMAAMRRLPGEAAGGRKLEDALKPSLEPLRLRTSMNARPLRQPGTSPRGGHLDEGVAIAKKASRGQFYQVWWVSFVRRARKIAHLVEFGTLPHWQPRRFGGIMHPGARPKPFMRPAFESTKHEVLRQVGNRIWTSIKQSVLTTTSSRRR